MYKIKLYNGSVKHILGKPLRDAPLREMTVLKEEAFGLQLMVEAEAPYFCQLSKINDIGYKGLIDKLRFDISLEGDDHHDLSVAFLGYTKDDDSQGVGDRLESKKAMAIKEGTQAIWINGKISSTCDKDHVKLHVKAYSSKAYEDERLVVSETLTLEVLDYCMEDISKGDFYLDLWQHPCNWARAYDVDYYSEEHFQILDNYLKDLGALGQKVVDLIVTDYPWAGQRCYEVEANPANLFEMNMVGLVRDCHGDLQCDFSVVDRYIDLCFKHGIDGEINLFGLIGNWDAFAFGNPVQGHKDALRIQYYDQKKNIFSYIDNKKDLKVYLSQVFMHMVEGGHWDKTYIMSDEPNDVEVFNGCADFLQEAITGHDIKMKSALHHQQFFVDNGQRIKSLSLNTCEMVNNIDKLAQLKADVNKKQGLLTWYSCCFPEDLNIFLCSPLIESRLTGWFTYYMEMDGFLRWAYGVWPGNVFEDASYKKDKWRAGDMFLVYPGKNLKPMHSVRYMNFKFGIQDFNLFKAIEKKASKETLMAHMAKLLGQKTAMKFIEPRSIAMAYGLSYEDYMALRNDLVKTYLL